MTSTSFDLLLWARGPGFEAAVMIFLVGMVWRLIETFSLGRKPDLSLPRDRPGASGMHTVFRRFLFPPGMLRRAPVTYLGGYIFHIGFGIVLLFFIPHIELARGVVGFGWPGLPTPFVDLVAVITMVTLLVMLVSRLTDPAKRFISTFEDYFTWALTVAPLLTGYLAYHHLLLPYRTMLAVHILAAELLLVAMPFTKLIHFVTLFPARWFNGDLFGHKGVAS
ncbi:MAG: hypothetical protein PVF51_02410 [Nitrospirota bacterium]|jgi:nitrate reductase gamma subunit